MLFQSNTPERATVMDDVTHRMFCCQTDICIVGFTQNNVEFIIAVMTHR